MVVKKIFKKQLNYIVMMSLYRKRKKKKQSFCRRNEHVHIREINVGEFYREKEKKKIKSKMMTK